MNRRTSLKGLILLTSVGISSFSLYRLFVFQQVPDLSILHTNRDLIAELADLIIPRTDTPGAKDANVQRFIIDIIEFCSDSKTQNDFVNGIMDLESYMRRRYGTSFLQCSKVQQIEALQHFEDTSLYRYEILNKIHNKLLGAPFFSILKSTTIEGYCISMLGATQGLVYDYIPVTHIGCTPLKSNQRSWATR